MCQIVLMWEFCIIFSSCQHGPLEFTYWYLLWFYKMSWSLLVGRSVGLLAHCLRQHLLMWPRLALISRASCLRIRDAVTIDMCQNAWAFILLADTQGLTLSSIIMFTHVFTDTHVSAHTHAYLMWIVTELKKKKRYGIILIQICKQVV